MSRYLRLCFATVSLIGATGFSQAQVALTSNLNLGVFADANQNDGHSQTDSISQAQSGTLHALSGSLSVTDTESGGGTLNVTSAATATWASAGQGTVAMRNMGWTHNTHTQSGARLNNFVAGPDVWDYTFIATANHVFTMNYDVRATGAPFGLQGFRIEWNGTGGGLDLSNPYTPVAHGTFLRSVSAGTTYTVALFNMGNIFTSADPRNGGGHMDADFNWTVGTVPEPSSLVALSVLGLVFVRRRRS